MKNTVFRSVEFWKSALMTLPDSSFFELLRSVFGKIKTPFNKQILLDELESFLLREDIQKNIAAYIDRNDAAVIAAVATLNEPAPGELESFFSGELSYVELQELVVNLEERFIFYRFREKGLGRLALNPVLEPVLAPFIADTSLLFPSVPPAGDAAPAPAAVAATPLNDRVLAGLLSFTAERELFFKNEGGIRKRVTDAASAIFPGLDVEPVIGGLRVLGLLRAEKDKIIPDYRYFSGFGKLSPRERAVYCAAGIYCFRDSESAADISPYLLRATVAKIAGAMYRFLNSLDAEQVYSIRTLKRIVNVLGHNAGTTRNTGTNEKKINGALFLWSLEKTGLLLPVQAEYRRPGPLAAQSADGAGAGAETDTREAPHIAMDAAFSCMVYPEISYADAVNLASMFEVREAGVSVRFEMTRTSALRAFNRGISAAAITELLKRLSANRIDENLIWTLNEWEKRYGEVTLSRGLVLSLSPERRYLVETKPLSRLIKKTLAPGVYLLAQTAEAEAAEALHTAGVDIVARYGEDESGPGADGHDDSPGGIRKLFAPLCSGDHHKNQRPAIRVSAASPRPLAGAKAGAPGSRLSTSTLIKGFHSILERMRFSKAERDELAARIDRRLVLCESQLKDASVRYEKLEARGLDFTGKTMIAKQAIALQSPMELVLAGKNGKRIFGIPTALEKKNDESVLVISSPGEGDTLRIPLGKISHLRRIKKSLFETSI